MGILINTMEAQIHSQVTHITQNANVDGVLILDKYGMTVESSGSLNTTHSSTVSSILKNTSKLSSLLKNEPQISVLSQPFAQFEFEKSTLSLKGKNDVSMAIKTKK